MVPTVRSTKQACERRGAGFTGWALAAACVVALSVSVGAQAQDFGLYPSTGATAGNTLVLLECEWGNDGSAPAIRFGGVEATDVQNLDLGPEGVGYTILACVAPPADGPGVVDVTVDYGNGQIYYFPQAFRYVDMILDGQISGTVYASDGVTPVTSALVWLFGDDDSSFAARTDASGHFSASVPSALYTVCLWSRGSNGPDLPDQFLLYPAIEQDVAVGGNTVQDIVLPAPLRLSGYVRNGSGAAMPGVTVSATASDMLFCTDTCVSDASGRYELVLFPDEYVVTAEAPIAQRLISEPQSLFLLQDYAMDILMQPGALLSGTVYGSDGTTPAPNLQVLVDFETSDSYLWTRTDAAGHYEVLLPEGYASLGLWSESGHSLPFPAPQSFGLMETAPFPIAGDTVHDVVLPEFATVTGRVVDWTGAGVAGARLETYTSYEDKSPYENYQCRDTATTDAAGNFTLTLLPDSYAIFVTPPAGVPLWPTDFRYVTVPSPTPLTLELESAYVLSGTVRAADGTTPVSGIQVGVYDDYMGSAVGVSDASGHYETLIPAGRVTLGATGSSSSSAGPNQPLPLNFSLVLDQLTVMGDTVYDVQLPAFVTLSGRVTNAAGTPMPGVVVSANDSSYESVTECFDRAVTDASGLYALTLLPGDYNVEATPPLDSGLWRAVANGVVVYGSQTLDLSLSASHVVTGTLRTAAGAPVSNASLTFRWGDQSAYAQTSTDGRYQTTLPTATITASVSASGGRTNPNVPDSFGIRPIGTFSVSGDCTQDLTLPPFVTVTGRVLDRSGNPVVGAAVEGSTYSYPSGGYASSTDTAVTDASGRYQLLLTPGSLYIGATPPAGSHLWSFDSYVGDTPSGDFDIALDPAVTVSGTVYAADGTTPVGGVDVYFSGPSSDSVDTDSAGHYSLLLRAGTYSVSASTYPWQPPAYADGVNLPDTFYLPQLLASVVATTDIVQDVVLPEFVEVTGRVLDPSGVGIEGVTVETELTSAWNGRYADCGDSGVTDATGRYRLYVLPEAEYRIETHVPDGVRLWDRVLSQVWLPAAGDVDLWLGHAWFITGAVYKADGVTPVAGVTVEAVGHSLGAADGTAETDVAGHYTLRLPPGLYDLNVHSDWEEPPYKAAKLATPGLPERFVVEHLTESIALESDVARDLVLPATVTLEGQVTDPEGAPVPRARVYAAGYGNSGAVGYGCGVSARTDAAGHYTMTLFAGTYALDVYPPADLPLAEGHWENVAVAANTTRDLPLERAILLHGTVYAPDRATPVAGVKVGVQAGWTSIESTSGATGQYQLRVPAGIYSIAVSSGSLYAFPGPASFSVNPYATGVPMTHDTIYNIVLPTFARVSGFVTGPDNAPVPGAHVETYRSWSEGGISFQCSGDTHSDAQGAYELYLLPGTYDIEAYPPSGSTYSGTVAWDVLADGETSLDLMLQQQTVVQGTLFASDGTTPLPNVSVKVCYPNSSWGPAQARTDQDGRYRIAVGPGTYDLGVYYEPSYGALPIEAPESFTVYGLAQDLSLTGEHTQNLVLPAFRVLTGRVLDRSGAAVAGAALYADGYWWVSDGGSRYSEDNAVTDATGAYRVVLFPGGCTLTVTPPDGVHLASASPYVNVSTTTIFDVQLPPLYLLSGTLYAADGVTPVRGVTVTTGNSESYDSPPSSLTDENGHYEMWVPEGSYILTAWYEKAWPSSDANIPMPDYLNRALMTSQVAVQANTQRNLTLPPFVVQQGVVTGAGDNGLPRAYVSAHMDTYTDFGWTYCGSAAEADAAGAFEFVLLAGTYTVDVEPEPASRHWSDEFENIAVPATPWMALHLNPGATLSGTVYAADGITPVAGAEVIVHDAATQASVMSRHTDLTGRYCLPLWPGNYNLAVVHDGYDNPYEDWRLPWPQYFDIVYAATNIQLDTAATRDILLPPLVTVTGHARDIAGAPVQGTQIDFEQDWTLDGVNYYCWGTADTNVDGSYRLTVFAGTSWLAIDPPLGLEVVAPTSDTFDASADSTLDIVLYNPNEGTQDTDGDGLPDQWEVPNGLDPADASGDNGADGDPDGDGLSNADEFTRGTDPRSADSDGDGILDGDETESGRLRARLQVPPQVRPGRTYTLWIEYTNIGGSDMPAPLFVVSSPQLVPMRLSQAEPFRSEPVQVLGIGAEQPFATLPAGASGRLPVQFKADADTQVDFNLAVMSDDAGTVDWNAVKAQVQPADVDPGVWDRLWPAISSALGPRWGDYHRALVADAACQSALGRRVYSVRDLWAFEVIKALGVNPRSGLAGAVDAQCPAPALALAFSRVYLGRLDLRLYEGPLGLGWTHNYDVHLATRGDGTVDVHWSDGSTRSFRPNDDGTYTGAPGDHGKLRFEGGLFSLTEKDATVYRFDADSRLASVTDAAGNSVTLTYDATGPLTYVTHSDGDTFNLGYESGRIVSLVDHAGRETRFQYDTTGRLLTQVTAPGSVVTQYDYAPESGGPSDFALASVTQPDGLVQTFQYDELGRLAYEDINGNEWTAYSYDACGSVTIEDAAGGSTVISPDEYGRPTKVEDALGRSIGLTYGDGLELVRYTDPIANAFGIRRDPSGNALTLEDPLGNTVYLDYDYRFNAIRSYHDADGHITDFYYDPSGRLIRAVYPDGSDENWTISAGGVTVWPRSDYAVGISTNSRGQATIKSYGVGGTAFYTYDPSGRLQTGNLGTESETLTYNDRGLLARVDRAGGRWFSYEYDGAGRRVRRLGSDGFDVRYGYDEAGRLALVGDVGNAFFVMYTYDGAGRLAREERGNGTTTFYDYDAAGQLVSVRHFGSDNMLRSSYTYGYDADGNRTTVQTGDGTATLAYDARGRLTHVEYADASSESFDYDPAGNRVAVTWNGFPISYSVNALNQYVNVGGSACAYDANGNMITSTSGSVTCTYDVENRLTLVQAPDTETWQFEYDALGRRVASLHNGVRTAYELDPLSTVDVATELDDSGNVVARYIDGLGLAIRIDGSGNAAYYGFDATGNVVEMTDAAGNVINSYTYEAYGTVRQRVEGIANNPFTYAGRFGVREAAVGLYHAGLRDYDPRLGRFLQPDPVRNRAAYANLYTYAANNPAGLIDPTGTAPESPTAVLARLAGGGSATAADWFRAFATEAVDSFGYVPGAGIVHVLPRDPASPRWADGLLAPRMLNGASPAPWAVGYNVPETSVPAVWPGMPVTVVHTSTSTVIRPVDPNEKVGPAGTGVERAVGHGDLLEYIVYFENRATALAPAQEVVVTDQLDPDLDWSTLALGEIAWGSHTLSVPAGSQTFTTRVNVDDYRPEVSKTWWVDITAELNTGTGVLTWTFRTLDPDTGDLPEDAAAGFLPPNDATHRGEGHMAFTIRPQTGLSDGTEVDNDASIVFDTEAPIVTNTVSNIVTQINRAPEIAPLPDRQDAENAWVTLTPFASDADGDTLVYSASGLPSGLAISPETGVVSGRIDWAAAGVYQVAIAVFDGQAMSSGSFQWTVTNVNRAPSLTNPGNQAGIEGQTVALAVAGTDPDGDSLAYSTTGLPSGLAINPASGVIGGTLAFDAAGSHDVVVSVSDGESTAQQSFTWLVEPAPDAPVIEPLVGLQTDEAHAVTLQIQATNPGGATLTYSATGLPPGLSIAPATGLITGRIDEYGAGDYSVTVTVSNGSASSSASFGWKVWHAEDLDRNGAINASDVQIVINAVLGRPTPRECDVNDLEGPNALDIQLVINTVLGRRQ